MRNDLVDHTQRLQPERCPAVSQHLHLEQDLARDVPCEDGLDHHRPDADVDLRCPEGRRVDGDEDVAGAGQAQSAGESMSVDPADDRFAELGHQDEQLDEEIAAAVALQPAHLAIEARQVRPRAEDAARPGQDYDSDLLLVAAPAKRGREVAQHGRGERVSLLRAVQGDGRDRPVRGEQDLLQGWLVRHGT